MLRVVKNRSEFSKVVKVVFALCIKDSRINADRFRPILEVLLRVADEDVADKGLLVDNRRSVSLPMILARFFVIRPVHSLVFSAAIARKIQHMYPLSNSTLTQSHNTYHLSYTS